MMTRLLLAAIMLCCNLMMPRHCDGLTAPSDVQALMQIKACVDPGSIRPSSCLRTWDFAHDPCDNLNGALYFECGFECRADTSGVLRITSLKLDVSGYTGTISPSVGGLSALQFLQISGNSVAGRIPSAIGRLTQLLVLDLSSNALSGPLPESLGLLRSLRSLNVAGNSLQGALPSSFVNLANAVDIRMHDNGFSGSLPDVGQLARLQMLDLSSNLFSGGLPLRFPPDLISASLSGNRLSGGLTRDHVLGLNPLLNVLDLRNNRLSGSIDSSLFRHPSLQQLNLSHNAFTGISYTADVLGVSASNFIAIDISYNQVAGRLPGLFSSMKQLSSLSLSHNAFNGRIPVSYGLKAVAGLVGLEPLQRLMLDGNYLTGPLPSLFMRLLPGRIMVSLADNCLWNCPSSLFFCLGGDQKSESVCKLSMAKKLFSEQCARDKTSFCVKELHSLMRSTSSTWLRSSPSGRQLYYS